MKPPISGFTAWSMLRPPGPWTSGYFLQELERRFDLSGLAEKARATTYIGHTPLEVCKIGFWRISILANWAIVLVYRHPAFRHQAPERRWHVIWVKRIKGFRKSGEHPRTKKNPPKKKKPNHEQQDRRTRSTCEPQEKQESP